MAGRGKLQTLGDRMKLIAQNETCRVLYNRDFVLGNRLTQFILVVQGRKGFERSGLGYWFETTQRNIERWLELFPECELVDERQKSRVNKDHELLIMPKDPRPEFSIVHPQYKFQERGFVKTKDLKVTALFMGTGTGKTKMTIDKTVYLWCKHEIDGLLILTKKGVHEQWVEEQLPEHVPKNIPYVAHAWGGMTTVREKKQFEAMLNTRKKLLVFSINIDATWTKKGMEYIEKFVKRFRGRLFAAVDESQDISDPETRRGQALLEVRDDIEYRAILSGTPISVNLENIWGQFHFLDPDIIGHKYKTAFRAEYCNMIPDGFGGMKILSHKNLERFYARIDQQVFRATKEEDLDLPEKVYKREFFQMTDKQRKVYEELRQDFITKLDNGKVATVDHAATMIMRLQQIACGFIVDEDGEVTQLDNPRLERAIELDRQIGVNEKKIFWCRFKEDYLNLMKAFGKRAVDYVGATSDVNRSRNKAMFLDRDSGKDILISNPAAGGTGLNLQGECAYAIYYSNSFNAVHRWQSEDRIHRIGTYKTTFFIDMVASRTVDQRILQNLKAKKEFSDLVLDDIRKMFDPYYAEAA
jgi:SNF2 family DNA or RNA helicase